MVCIGFQAEEHQNFITNYSSELNLIDSVPAEEINAPNWIRDLLGIKEYIDQHENTCGIFQPNYHGSQTTFLFHYGEVESLYIHDVRKTHDQFWVLPTENCGKGLLNKFPNLSIVQHKIYLLPRNSIWLIAYRSGRWKIKKFGLTHL